MQKAEREILNILTFNLFHLYLDFQDQEIINGDPWQGTVIIQEPAEFLCIDQEVNIS